LKGRSAGNNNRTTPKHIRAGKLHIMVKIPENAAMPSNVMTGKNIWISDTVPSYLVKSVK